MPSKKSFLKTPISYAIALTASLVSIPAKALSEADRAYYDSDYGFCDAKKIADVWKLNTGEAKVVIGKMILVDLKSLIDQSIQWTQGRVSCDFNETDLSFSDAQKLSQYWGKPVSQAKEKATQMVSEMGTKRFRELMANALGR